VSDGRPSGTDHESDHQDRDGDCASPQDHGVQR
jgi:hypothetical protein